MSSAVEFFDILYLGIFTILSPAFDRHFYAGQSPPPGLGKEISHAAGHFHSLMNIFSLRFIIFLGGEPLAISYVVDKFLAEFVAASVVFANTVGEQYEDCSIGGGGVHLTITAAMFMAHIKGVPKALYPKVFFHYSRCLERSHSHFTWTGPDTQIFPRSEDIESIIHLSTKGEMLDHPADPIYLLELESNRPSAVGPLGKHPVAGDSKGSTEGVVKKQKLTS